MSHRFTIFLLLLTVFAAQKSAAQLTVSGTVLDSSRLNYVSDVKVMSTGGMFAVTDTLGRYHIPVNEKDSLSFVYKNKPTQKFAVTSITDLQHFDIALKINIPSKYRFIKEVIVFSKSYKQDSAENRQTYADVFNYKKPGIQTNISPTGGVGADPNEIINIFRFKRNRQLRKFQLRLEKEEEEKYVDYRFNKRYVKRITQLPDAEIERFMLLYRPSYEFASNSTELEFNQYVLNCSYEYRAGLLKKEGK